LPATVFFKIITPVVDDAPPPLVTISETYQQVEKYNELMNTK
jgi:hypothetical protein